MSNTTTESTADVSNPLAPFLFTAILGIFTIYVFFQFRAPKRAILQTPQMQENDAQECEKFLKNNDSAIATSLWQVGVGEKSVSVGCDGVLRQFHFTKSNPTSTEIINCIKMAAFQPMEGSIQQKPKLVSFLESRQCSDATLKAVANEFPSMKVLKNETVTRELLESEFGIIQKRASETKENRKSISAAPPRMCIVCSKQIIDKKPSQCSACKAVIYCGVDCAKSDWPNHKKMCPLFKNCIQSAETKKLHHLPFTFYNSKTTLPVYNLLEFLVQNSVMTVGLYRRLTTHFASTPFGRVLSDMKSQLDELDELSVKYELLGIPGDLAPLSKAKDSSKIVDWQSLYKELGLELSEPLALILEVPMTLYFIFKKFWFHNGNDSFFITKGIPKRFVFHIVGAEKEADLVPLYEILAGLFPGLELYLILVGPRIAQDLSHSEKLTVFTNNTLKSSVKVLVHHGIYDETCVTGAAFEKELGFVAKPDGAAALNGNFLNYETWQPTILMLAQHKIKAIFSEAMESSAIIDKLNFSGVGVPVTMDIVVNPFRQPLLTWSPEHNIPAWSNAFLFGIN